MDGWTPYVNVGSYILTFSPASRNHFIGFDWKSEFVKRRGGKCKDIVIKGMKVCKDFCGLGEHIKWNYSLR